MDGLFSKADISVGEEREIDERNFSWILVEIWVVFCVKSEAM